MKTCDAEGEVEYYPKPTSLTTHPINSKSKNSKVSKKYTKTPAVEVRECLGHGSSNNVYNVAPARGWADKVLRATSQLDREAPEPPEAMSRENALMRIAAAEKIHPIIHAQSLMHAPFRCYGFVSATLMQKEVPFPKFLKNPEFDHLNSDQAKLSNMFTSLYAAICRAADLGLCLCDIKPANVVCIPEKDKCHLIDFGLEFVVWMDPKVFEMFEHAEDASGARDGAACANTRGVQLYIMLLLFYTHLTSFGDFLRSPRAQYFAGRLRGILAESCVPNQALLGLSDQYGGYKDQCKQRHESEEDKDLMHILFCRVKRYFQKNLKWFLVDFVYKYGLRQRNCDGKSLEPIRVGGKEYSNDAVSCASKRGAVLRRLDERQYPCLNVESEILPQRQYIIDHGKASVKTKGEVSSKGFGKGAAGTFLPFTPVEVLDLRLEYATDALPKCPE